MERALEGKRSSRIDGLSHRHQSPALPALQPLHEQWQEQPENVQKTIDMKAAIFTDCFHPTDIY